MPEAPVRRLELTYEVTNLASLYQEKAVRWDRDNAEFTAGKDFTGTLRLWKDGVEPEQVWEAKKRLEERAEECREAFRYRGNHEVVFKGKGYPIYRHDSRKFPVYSEKEVNNIADHILRGKKYVGGVRIELTPASLTSTGHISLVLPLPKSMPFIPNDLHWLAETLVLAAEEQSRHPDHAMRLAYFVLEKLEREPPDELKHARDFVSHPICGNTNLVAKVGNALPSSKTRSDEGKDAVRFLRTDEQHLAFVKMYAAQALHRAKQLFEKKVRADGGSLGD